VTDARLARKLSSAIGMDDWVRVRLGRVGGSLVASPLPRGAGVLTSLVRADGLLVVPTEVEGHHDGERVQVKLLRDLTQIDHTIVAIGSHDLVLDLAASSLRAEHPALTLASSNVGSMGGLIAVRDGLCHLAGSHLLDPVSGRYTLPYLDRLLPDRPPAVMRLVHREQGLLVAAGNPLDLQGVPDLTRPGLRYVNRQRGILRQLPDPDHRAHIDVPLSGCVRLRDLLRGHLQKDLPLLLRRELPTLSRLAVLHHHVLLIQGPDSLPGLA
jgi:molybdopterin molybdotransferase/putative molybdopterin biosynthesis protein